MRRICGITSFVVLLTSCCCVVVKADAAQINTAIGTAIPQPRTIAGKIDEKKTIKNNTVSSISDDEAIITNNETKVENNSTSPVNSNDDNDIVEEVDPVDSILSDISHWMKKQQFNNAALIDEQLFDADDNNYLQQPRILRRPFITLAYAQTLDGMIAAKLPNETTTANMRISSPESMVLTHKLRNIHDAILVGGATFALDEPRLTARLEKPTTFQQPLPIVLDTHLRNLYRILFGTTFPADSALSEETTIPEEISVERIRANNPIICCSNQAAFSFLDLLEIFQDQHLQRKRPKTSYKIIVYKKIDENDHMEDACMPIKITVQATHHNKKEEDVVKEVTFTLLPCPMNERTNSVSLKDAMSQLSDQFEVRSVMVEGGAGILSSFLSECGDDESQIVHCMCVTIAPTILGGLGLPSLGGFDTFMKVKAEENGMKLPALKSIAGRFVTLGQDCVFLGRL